jgi:hypothetical protein
MEEKIKVKSNKRNKTFTIRKYVNNILSVKYRTIQMNKDEFEVEEMNTENDWRQFLKTDNYYIIK